VLLANELKKYAFIRRLKTLEHVRKDYLQDLALFILYRDYPELVFKGGTCLWKLFKLPRFSEDLDLSYSSKIDPVNDLMEKLHLLGFEVEVLKKKFTANTLFLRLSVSAEGFGGSELSLEIGFRREEAKEVLFTSPYPDIPDFEVRVPPLEKIAQDKVSAILHRDKPRDVFDLYFLISRYGVKIGVENFEEFERAIERERPLWKSLEPLVVAKLPEFEEVKRVVLRGLG